MDHALVDVAVMDLMADVDQEAVDQGAVAAGEVAEEMEAVVVAVAVEVGVSDATTLDKDHKAAKVIFTVLIIKVDIYVVNKTHALVQEFKKDLLIIKLMIATAVAQESVIINTVQKQILSIKILQNSEEIFVMRAIKYSLTQLNVLTMKM